MIIWGSTGRQIEQERGQFNCPRCNSEREFRRMRAATYFTLYFIPLFETQYHGDYIECLMCGGQYETQVLDYQPRGHGNYASPRSDADQLVDSIRAELESGTPLQMARTKLVNSGVPADVAEKLVNLVAGNQIRSCSACRIHFASTIDKCSMCGSALASQTAIRAS